MLESKFFLNKSKVGSSFFLEVDSRPITFLLSNYGGNVCQDVWWIICYIFFSDFGILYCTFSLLVNDSYVVKIHENINNG